MTNNAERIDKAFEGITTNPPLTIFFDGACEPNPGGPAGVGVVAYQPPEQTPCHVMVVAIVPGTRCQLTQFVFESTSNNLAEFVAACYALDFIERCCTLLAPNTKIIIYGDSNLVIQRMTGRWTSSVKGIYGPWFHWANVKARALKRKYNIVWKHIPRSENQEADKLSKQGFRKAKAVIGV